MSSPNQDLREIELIKFGLLAARTIEVADKLLQGTPLHPEEKQIIVKASDFLQEIANGAELVTIGRYRGHNSIASMRALDYAMEPLERLRDLVADKEIADVFRHMSEILQAAEARPSAVDVPIIKQIREFFVALNDSLLEAIKKQNPPVGVGRTRKVVGL